MRAHLVVALAVFAVILQSCSSGQIRSFEPPARYHKKSDFNSAWRKQGVSPELWYYRYTVVDAPANTQALGVAEGHWLHPEAIRFEITKDLLMGYRAHSSVLNADHEFNEGMREHYRGAPVVAFPITEHFDLLKDPSDEHAEVLGRIYLGEWHEREYFSVDWSKNIISQISRDDEDEGIASNSILNSNTHLIDDGDISQPKRPRFAKDYFDITTRHPLPASKEAFYGKFGDAFSGDGAAVVLDVRHSFFKAKPSDFVSLHYPDYLPEVSTDNQSVPNKAKLGKLVDINNRFGLFRTSFNGRPIYNHDTGSLTSQKVVNATIFNIWQRSLYDNGDVIPIEQREIKPIFYYLNVLHPDNLMDASMAVAKEWDLALRKAVYYAQPQKHSSLSQVPSVLILKENSCSAKNVDHWFTEVAPHTLPVVEEVSGFQWAEIKSLIGQAQALQAHDYNAGFVAEVRAKKDLERMCSALEYLTEDFADPFIYQRAGDLRFNLMNVEVENAATRWSGYGPMFANPITGEIISATANVNLKYIDVKAQQTAKQIGLLTASNPAWAAVFGDGSKKLPAVAKTKINREIIEGFSKRARQSFGSESAHSPNEMASLTLDALSSHEKSALLAGIKTIGKSNKKAKGQEPRIAHKDNAAMDSLRFIDDIALGLAFKLSHLPEQERFLKIRKLIYQAVMLHEVGHNLGLKHNMAGSSDALNYGEEFWQIEQLPEDLRAAHAFTKNAKFKQQLAECIEAKKAMAKNIAVLFGDGDLNAKACLQQKNGMYSSIMDYHASSLADIKGLGGYDVAAIKWAYGNVVEVFPKNNLVSSPDTSRMAHWLKLNDYRHIPQALLKGSTAVHQRKHVKVFWGHKGFFGKFPDHAVPYAYCDDSQAVDGATCLSYDFGPTMESSARWLRSRYWSQYLMTHFAKDSTTGPVARDVDTFERFNKMLRWYYKYAQSEEDFAGSFLEEDFLKALAIGLNHYAQVIALPEPGLHMSAPNFTLENSLQLPSTKERLQASYLLKPFSGFELCESKSLTKKGEYGQLAARFDYRLASVPLGIGRPLNDRYNQGIALYAGSDLVKKYALKLLTAPMAKSLSPDSLEHEDLLRFSWYQIFPSEVSKIYGAILTEDYQKIGAYIDNEQTINLRRLIDEETLLPLAIDDLPTIAPAMDESIREFALKAAIEHINEPTDDGFDLAKSIRISKTNTSGDVFYNEDEDVALIKFIDSFGSEYRAPKLDGEMSVGAILLQKANEQKARYLRLRECVSNNESRKNDPLCACVKTRVRVQFDQWECCSEDNRSCSGPQLEEVGQGICTLEELRGRVEKSHDQLVSMVGFIDKIRAIFKKASSIH